MQECEVCHMILSQSGPCPLCGSNTHDKSSPSGATSTDLEIETEAEIELPFGLADSDSVVDSNRLPFGLEDAPEDAPEDAHEDAVEGADSEEESELPKTASNKAGTPPSESVELPYGIDDMYHSPLD